MDRRVIGIVFVGGLVLLAGCGGLPGGGPTATPTATPTPTSAPAATTTADTPATTTATPTTTTTPTPAAAFKVSYPTAFEDVRDGTLSVPVTVTNTGDATGERTLNVTFDRQVGDFYTETVSETVTVDPGESVARTYEYEFQATGTYTVLVDGDRVGELEVRGLDADGGSSDGEETTTVTPGADVTGASNPGAE